MIPSGASEVRLGELLHAIRPSRVLGSIDLGVKAVVADSRSVMPGSLFVALPGEKSDGHTYVSEAVAKGAIGIVVTRPVNVSSPVSIIEVEDGREALALLSAAFYHYPARRLRLTGVTGTNGKTTITFLVREILKAAGRRVGLIGTIAYELGEEKLNAPHTTPDPPLLQRLLAEVVNHGIEDVVMEVSSHALELSRVKGCEFDVGVFTNLTQDHLDFHGDMERYFSAKEKLFAELGKDSKKQGPKRAIINRDDSWGQRLLHRTGVPTWSYGCSREADIWSDEVFADVKGIRFRAHTPSGDCLIRSPLLGSYNVSNILAAIGVGLHYGLPLETLQKGISEVANVPGRFEPLDEGQDFTVIVDYAHTEAALDRLLHAVQAVSQAKILTVFGCGGDRDPGKRFPMGKTAARLSDRVIITSDNPRSENAFDIIHEIERGVAEGIQAGGRTTGYEIISDRKNAIDKAIHAAKTGDVVVVAGKGHEDYQLIGSERLAFDDRVVAREAIRKRLGARSA